MCDCGVTQLMTTLFIKSHALDFSKSSIAMKHNNYSVSQPSWMMDIFDCGPLKLKDDICCKVFKDLICLQLENRAGYY